MIHGVCYYVGSFCPDFSKKRVAQYPISELAQPLCTVGGASWTLDPSKEAVNCKIKHTNKFVVYNNFKLLKKGITFSVEIKVFKIYYSFLDHI